MEIARDPSKGILKITGTVDIGGADQLQNALRDFLSEVPAMVLDLSEAESCDTTALQLLWSAKKTAESLQKRFELAGIPASIVETASELGISLASLSAFDNPRRS